MWSTYSALLFTHKEFKILVLAAQPMGIVEKNGVNILNGQTINGLMENTLNNLVGFMIRHACNLLNLPIID